MSLHIDPSRLRPGEITPYARHVFTTGACAAFAIALQDAIGWPIVGITDHDNVYYGKLGMGSCLHWTVRRPDGLLIDIDGAHDEAEMIEYYDDEADDGKAAAGTSSRDNTLEWYEDCQGAPVSIALAATFVPPLLKSLEGGAGSPAASS